MTPEELKDLKEGISRLLEVGATYDQIYGILSSKGWAEEDIALVLDKQEAVRIARYTHALSSPLQLLANSLRLTFSRFGNLLPVLLVTGFLSLLLLALIYWLQTSGVIGGIFETVEGGVSTATLMTPMVTFGLLVITFFFSGILTAVPASLLSGVSGEKKTFRKNIATGFSRTYQLLAVALVAKILIALGLVFLIIPGIVFSIWFFFAPAVVVLEKTSPLDSFSVSRNLVRGRGLATLLRMLILVLITALFALVAIGIITPLAYLDMFGAVAAISVTVVVALLLSLATLFFMIFTASFYISLYKELKGANPSIIKADKSGKVIVSILVPIFIVITGALVFFFPQVRELVGIDSRETTPVGEVAYAEPLKYTDGTMLIGGEELQIAVADDNDRRITGLSRQENIESNQGLLFVFDRTGYHGIWMRDMNFPIDIIWLDENLEVVSIKKQADPSSFRTTRDAETFLPERAAKYVLETASGFADRVELQVGETTELNIHSETTQ